MESKWLFEGYHQVSKQWLAVHIVQIVNTKMQILNNFRDLEKV
jgi:hypothetical protein